MKIFKPTDFEAYRNDCKTLSDRANEIFEKWLDEQQTVYGHSSIHGFFPKHEIDLMVKKPELEAKIVCIEPIQKPCEHTSQIITYTCGLPAKPIEAKCVSCGVQLKPKGWVPA